MKAGCVVTLGVAALAGASVWFVARSLDTHAQQKPKGGVAIQLNDMTGQVADQPIVPLPEMEPVQEPVRTGDLQAKIDEIRKDNASLDKQVNELQMLLSLMELRQDGKLQWRYQDGITGAMNAGTIRGIKSICDMKKKGYAAAISDAAAEICNSDALMSGAFRASDASMIAAFNLGLHEQLKYNALQR